MNILLGSLSPRRKELLSRIVDNFRVYGRDIDETQVPGESPADYSARISRDKAREIIPSIPDSEQPCLLITSDTIVTIDGIILGKPESRKDAEQILGMLQSRTHSVISSITLTLLPADPEGSSDLLTGTESTGVTFRPLTRAEIGRYLDMIDYRDKAGAYAIQEHGDLVIQEYSGSLTNIIGFPLRLFFSMTVQMGIANSILNLDLPPSNTKDTDPGI